MSDQLTFVQTSYNDWGTPPRGMLLDRVQPSKSATLPSWESVFDNLEQQIAEHEVETERTLSSLASQFIFNDTESVTLFLKAHRSVSPILLESIRYLEECFGSGNPLSLEVMTDEGTPEVIYVLVLWNGDRSTARRNLSLFDELWWMENMKRAGGKVVFDYELV